MKKILFSTLIAVTLFTSGFAAETDKRILNAESSLKMEFKNASKVQWSHRNGLMKASFLDNGNQTEAFFGTDGKMIATCKMINPDAVPTSAKIKLAKKFTGYIITEAINYQDADGEAYFVSAENDTQKVIIKSKDGVTSIFKKSLKK